MTPQQFTLLDPGTNEARCLDVPAPVALEDPVTGGIQGEMKPRAFFVAPDFIVIARTPALFVVRLAALEHALRADAVTWRIATKLPLADPSALAPARSIPSGIAIDRFVMRDRITDAVRARGWLWPPAGWASIESKAGSLTPLRQPPRERAVADVDVARAPLRRVAPLRFVWPPVPRLPPAGDAPKGFEALASVSLAKTTAGAVRLARKLRLDERTAAYGALGKDIFANLHALGDPDAEDREDVASDLFYSVLCHQGSIYDGTAYALLPLVAILADPTSPAPDELALQLASLVDAGRTRLVAEHDPGERSAAEALRYAVRRTLPLLVAGPPASDRTASEERRLLRAWRALLVVAAALEPRVPPWMLTLAAADRALAGMREHAATVGIEDLLTGFDE